MTHYYNPSRTALPLQLGDGTSLSLQGHEQVDLSDEQAGSESVQRALSLGQLKPSGSSAPAEVSGPPAALAAPLFPPDALRFRRAPALQSPPVSADSSTPRFRKRDPSDV